MIYEFAVEPQLVAQWHDRVLGKLLQSGFGLGTGRVVCRFPKRWKAQIIEECDRLQLTFIQREQVTELVQQLADVMTTRNYQYDPNKTWVTNAIAESQRNPFRLILNRDNWDTSLDTAAWKVPRSVIV